MPVTQSLTLQQRSERRKLMADRVKVGRDVGEAAAFFGVTDQTVRIACKEHGVELPPRVYDRKAG